MREIVETNRAGFLAYMRRNWKQGQHIALIGPTGTGKTGLAAELLNIRKYVVALAVKRHDDTLKMFGGYRIIKRWPPDVTENKVILWIKPASLSDFEVQRKRILETLHMLYIAGGWCVYFDDLGYLTNQLRIDRPIITMVSQGRSSRLSVVSAVQRPRGVPLAALTQARYVIIWKYADEYELERAAEVAGIPKKQLIMLNDQLKVYPPKDYTDFLVFPTTGPGFLVRNV